MSQSGVKQKKYGPVTSVKHVNFVRRPLATLPVNHRRLSTEPWSERGAAVIIVNHPLPSSFILHPSSNVPSFEKGKEKKREKNIETAPTHHPPSSHLKLFHSLYNRSATFQKRHPSFLPSFLPCFLLVVVSRSFNGGHVSRIYDRRGSLIVSKTRARENSLPSPRGRVACSATRSRQAGARR